MSSINLLLLGMLKTQPMSAYDLSKHVERIRLKKWMKIGVPTIFQNVRKMVDKGLLAAHAERNGEMPEKMVYSVAPAGEEHFRKLMAKFAAEPGRIYFEFNAMVKNIDLLDLDEQLALLRDLDGFLEAQQQDLARDKEMVRERNIPLGMRAVMKQYDMVLASLRQWVAWLMDECRAGGAAE